MEHLVKLSHYQKEIAQFRKEGIVTPRRVQIDPVSYCNHDCSFCTYRFTRNKDLNALFDLKDMISFPKMVEILEDCSLLDVKAIELTGGGEPSLHPEFPSILSAIHEKGMEIGLITNGDWNQKHFDASVSELRKAEWVRFSLDAATPETHALTHSPKGRRGQDSFERAVASIAAITGYDVTVGVSFIVQRHNMHEVEAVVDLGARLGADYVRIGCVMFETERIDGIELTVDEHDRVSEIVNRVKAEASIEVWDNFTMRSRKDFQRYSPGDTCFYSYLGTTIGADLRLYPCCIWKYRPDGVIADLNKERLADVWESRALDRFYKRFDISDKCVKCFLKDKNDFIALSLDPNPRHLNFV